MIARTTTTSTLKTYRYNLQRSGYYMNKSMNTVQTGRLFNSFAEDPAAAALSFQKRTALLRNSAQRDLNTSIQYKFQQAWKAVAQIEENLDTVSNNGTFKALMLEGANDPDGSARTALGQSMTALAENMVQTMNGRYGENFIFAGADGLNVPFTWGAQTNPEYIPPDQVDPVKQETFKYLMDGGNGNKIGTNDPDLALPEANPDFLADPTNPAIPPYLDKDGNPTADRDLAAPRKNPNYNEMATFKYLTTDGTGTNNKSQAARTLCYRGIPVNTTNEAELEKLRYFSEDEVKNADIGLGFDTNGGRVETTSVFNQALQGVDFLGGYGVDADGDPKNVIAMVDRMGTILKNCDPRDGEFASQAEEDEYYRLAHKYELVTAAVKDQYVELDTRSKFLTTNATILESNQYNLQEQISGLEDVDEALAISDFIFAKYTYDTALKVGNSILSQSLMDYLNL